MVTRRWRWWFEDQQGTQAVVQNPESGDLKGFTTGNRFTSQYREMLFAKAQSLERSLRQKWGRLLHTAMVTLTATSTRDDGRPRPPLDHLNDLLSSWSAVRRALNRVLDGRDWEYLAIIEPQGSGYPHIHIGVFVKGVIVREQFAPVIEAHLRNSDGAGREAHELDDDTVSIHRAADCRNGTLDGLESLGAYLASYIGGEYETEALEQPRYVQRFYALMWASQHRWWRPSDGAQQYMQPEGDEEDEEPEVEWSFVGISPSGDPENDLIECEGGGTVSTRKVTHPPPHG